jgi:hypothetical protein
MKRYIHCDVLGSLRLAKKGGDCTNGGVSITKSQHFLECTRGNYTHDELVERMQEGDDDFAVYRVNTIIRKYAQVLYWDEETEAFEPSPRHHMAGGNYLTGDSRFTEMADGYPISIHDRIE